MSSGCAVVSGDADSERTNPKVCSFSECERQRGEKNRKNLQFEEGSEIQSIIWVKTNDPKLKKKGKGHQKAVTIVRYTNSNREPPPYLPLLIPEGFNLNQ